MKYIGKFPASEGFPKCQELNADLPLPKSEEENKNWRDGFDAVGATDGVLLDANDLENEGDFRYGSLIERNTTFLGIRTIILYNMQTGTGVSQTTWRTLKNVAEVRTMSR